MSNLQPSDAQRPAPPGRSSRHQIKRSISELTSPVRLHRQNPQHRRDRYSDNRDPYFSNPNISSRRSFDVSRSESATPMITPDQSRRASVMLAQDEVGAIMTAAEKEEKTRREKEQAAFCAEGLKQSLANLNTFSTTASKSLDDTYFSILEKMSTLQNTITALKDLADTSRDIHESFDKSARGLESEIVTQLGAIGRFESQQRRIERLQGRIHGGREKIKSLSERVDLVGRRIDSWERADKEWQERTRKRLRVIWTVMSAVVLAIVCLFLSVRSGPEPELGPGLTASAAAEPGRAMPPIDMTNASRLERVIPDNDEEPPSRTLPWSRRVTDSERLRVFDEL